MATHAQNWINSGPRSLPSPITHAVSAEAWSAIMGQPPAFTTIDGVLYIRRCEKFRAVRGLFFALALEALFIAGVIEIFRLVH